MARTSFSSLLSLLAVGRLAAAAVKSTVPYTDDKTGITFQGYSDEDGFRFGIAVPEEVTTDFIGQIQASITEGWAGVSLNQGMIDALLIATYPNGDSVTASLREASAYSNPGQFDGDAKLMPIAEGTYVNDTGFTYTFLCSGCILDDGRTFTPSDEVAILGYAMSTDKVDNPSATDSILNYHDTFGMYGMHLEDAASADFKTWADMASTGTPTKPSTPTSPSQAPTASAMPVTVSNTTYDYIIAGAGGAGIIVAERIAEKGYSVLLLERGAASYHSAGGELTMAWNDTVSPFDVPGVSFYLSQIDGANDAFCSDTAGMAGCVLGGGTAVNALNWVKPAERDFDDGWPEGWKWADVAEAADRVYERNPGTILPSSDRKFYDDDTFDVLSRHLQANGWQQDDAIQHPNHKSKMFGHTTYNIKDGLRAGPVRTYLPLAQARDNFKLQLNTKVVRAVRTGSTITGVEIEKDDKRQIINVNPNGKVILAAGSMSTPRILFNSGIGPREQIQTVQTGSTAVTLPEEAAWIELPVGATIMDHPIWYTEWTVNTAAGVAYAPLAEADFLDPTPEMAAQFAAGAGPLAQSGQRLDFFTDVTNADGSVRYVQGTCMPASNASVHVIVYLTHGATSAGALAIQGNGATTFAVEPWANTAGDREAVAAFFDTLLAYSRNPGSLLTYAGGANATGASMLRDLAVGSSEHYVGTARMGADDGRRQGGRAVVDLDTKVYGTDNLYVVDASAHPDLPTGNTQAMVYVVAEKAAERILASPEQPGGSAAARKLRSRGGGRLRGHLSQVPRG
ncbi:GMC oxidoreductase [Xylariomycetidae sp. FL0641]|nr:GMC oxidoreductase [Xylariomycetidae sp. FL0641]